MRGLAIVVGVALIERFHFVIYMLGIGLLILAWTDPAKGSAEHVDPDNNPFVEARLAHVPRQRRYEGTKFTIKRDGKRFVTPMALALVAIVAADIAFAIDSIPAAFAITDDPLRDLDGQRLRPARPARAVRARRGARSSASATSTRRSRSCSAVVAVKLLIQDLWKMPALISLSIVVGLFAAGIWLSIRADKREEGGGPPAAPQPSSAS